MHIQKSIYMQIHKNQLVAINLMKESIFDLVKSSIAYILHFGNKSISSSEIIIIFNVPSNFIFDWFAN